MAEVFVSKVVCEAGKARVFLSSGDELVLIRYAIVSAAVDDVPVALINVFLGSEQPQAENASDPRMI